MKVSFCAPNDTSPPAAFASGVISTSFVVASLGPRDICTTRPVACTVVGRPLKSVIWLTSKAYREVARDRCLTADMALRRDGTSGMECALSLALLDCGAKKERAALGRAVRVNSSAPTHAELGEKVRTVLGKSSSCCTPRGLSAARVPVAAQRALSRMPRAAAPLLSDHDAADGGDDDDEQPCTVLRSAPPSAAAGASESSSDTGRAFGDDASPRSVAVAFLTNVSGGAACYAVDIELVVDTARTDELRQALSEMQSLMALADTAGWHVDAVGDTTAVIVAQATTGNGYDQQMSTERQAFTLHVDARAGPRPITQVLAHERIKSDVCAEATSDE